MTSALYKQRRILVYANTISAHTFLSSKSFLTLAPAPLLSSLALLLHRTMIQVWDTESGRLTRVLKAHKGWVSDMVFIPFARTLVSGSVDGTLMCWSDTGKELQTMDFGGAVFCISFNAKRRTLAVRLPRGVGL